ncbi:unnamed protein product [Lathyrus oleraceus]
MVFLPSFWVTRFCVFTFGVPSFCYRNRRLRYCVRQLITCVLGLWRVIGCGSLMGNWVNQVDFCNLVFSNGAWITILNYFCKWIGIFGSMDILIFGYEMAMVWFDLNYGFNWIR